MPTNRLRRIAMFARFPRFMPRADPTGDPVATLLVDEEDEPVALSRACDEFPALSDALAELQDVVVPLYRECDAQAQGPVDIPDPGHAGSACPLATAA